uniref:Uncharacterized protein n=1 Tax=Lactuca sativa TaxID=4236 RepID=A0A9R1VR04_LACSA|nr:hypothetical protein LSAT_V11C400183500 [Lactuca sativa]
MDSSVKEDEAFWEEHETFNMFWLVIHSQQHVFEARRGCDSYMMEGIVPADYRIWLGSHVFTPLQPSTISSKHLISTLITCFLRNNSLSVTLLTLVQ